MHRPRTLASVWAAKAASLASRTLRRGGGTAAGGLLGLWLQPSLVGDLAAELGHGCVIVTGTNGKTTTARLIAAAATSAGMHPLANASGSNLMRGIASSLALATDPNGHICNAANRLGVFEVDEATVPEALRQLRPRAAVFTNLFRDQLDRYGEVETVAARWQEALAVAPAAMRLILNADDPSIARLGDGREDVLYFGIEDKKLGQGRPDHAADALFCRCGARLEYSAAFFSHVGHWRCPACGYARPRPAVAARLVKLEDGRSLRLQLVVGDDKAPLRLSLGGLYNVYNALAAVTAAEAIGLPLESTLAALTATGAAFGRQEAFEVCGKRVEVMLAKNPAGLNQVLSTLLLDGSRRTALIILNDGIADGRDISWIWDADFEVAAGRLERVVVGGTRAAEMALRLKYAEWDEAAMEVVPDAEAALDRALALTQAGECLTVIPTYTAMLHVRGLLADRTGRKAFWQP